MTALEALPKLNQVRKFEVEVPGLSLVVGFFTQISGFSTQVDVLEYPEGGRNDFVHRLPTRAKQGNITLKRGVTGEQALIQWFTKTVVQVQPENLSIALFDSNGERMA